MFIMHATLLLYLKKKYNRSEGEKERVNMLQHNHNRTIAIRHDAKGTQTCFARVKLNRIRVSPSNHIQDYFSIQCYFSR